jgi:hypothetical protein
MTVAHPDLLRTLRGVVRAPADAVSELLLDVGPHGRSPLLPLRQEQDASRVTVDVDRVARAIAVQGQWWYRAEYTIGPHRDGCLVTQQIFNVAQRLRWAVRYVARKPLAAAPDAFVTTLQQLGERLSCHAYALPPH